MKKKLFALLLTAALLFSLLPQMVLFASAATSGTCGDNLKWSFDQSTGTLTITGSGQIGYDIPWRSFAESIKKVILPNGLKSIGESAFMNCTLLTDIEIPNTVTSIGFGAFSHSGLTNIAIPNSVTSMGIYAIGGCENLSSVSIGTGLLEISREAFANCHSLTSIIIPSNVVEVVTNAFENSNNLTSIVILNKNCGFASPPWETTLGVKGKTTIYGYSGSTAQRYANEHGLRFAAIGKDYTDLESPKWYYSAANYMISKGYMGSTRSEVMTFEPYLPATRAMIVTMLYSLSGKPTVSYSSKFSDVQKGQWFTNAVMWAYQNGVVSGYDNGKFGPNDKVTREQMAVILKAYTEKVKGLNTSATTSLSGFADASKVTWSKPFIQWAVAEGLLSGKANGGKTYLDPQGNATRAEVAAIMKSFIVNIIET